MKPVLVELTDFKTKEKVDELEVDAVLVATGRAPYTQVLLLLLPCTASGQLPDGFSLPPVCLGLPLMP